MKPLLGWLRARRGGVSSSPRGRLRAADGLSSTTTSAGSPRRAGFPDDAAAHYEAALALNPQDFLASLNLGNPAARRRDWPAALRFYQQATALEPRSDDAQSNLGGIYLALGDAAQAESHLDRALALNPRNLPALQNETLLHARRGDLAGARELNRRALAIDPANPAALRLKGRPSAAPSASQSPSQ